MSFIADVQAELKALIIATLPDATTENVFMSIKAARINLPEKIKAGDISLPVWVLDAAEFNPDEWGVNSEAYRCPLRIIEIREVNATDQQLTLMENLRLINKAILEDDHTYFMADNHGSINAGPQDEAVQDMIDLGLQAVAGTLSFIPGILCGDWTDD